MLTQLVTTFHEYIESKLMKLISSMAWQIECQKPNTGGRGVWKNHLRIVIEFSCNHDARHKKAMNIERSQMTAGVFEEPIEVNLCNDKTGGAATEVLENPLHVLPNG